MSKNSSVLNTNTNKVRYPQFEWKFHVEIRKSDSIKYPQYFYAVLIARNHEPTFVGEMCRTKASIKKTAKSLFGEGVTIIDKTK